MGKRVGYNILRVKFRWTKFGETYKVSTRGPLRSVAVSHRSVTLNLILPMSSHVNSTIVLCKKEKRIPVFEGL